MVLHYRHRIEFSGSHVMTNLGLLFSHVRPWKVSNRAARGDSTSDFQRPQSERHPNRIWIGVWKRALEIKALQNGHNLSGRGESTLEMTQGPEDLSGPIFLTRSAKISTGSFVSCTVWWRYRIISKNTCLQILHESLKLKSQFTMDPAQVWCEPQTRKISRIRGTTGNHGRMPRKWLCYIVDSWWIVVLLEYPEPEPRQRLQMKFPTRETKNWPEKVWNLTHLACRWNCKPNYATQRDEI
jgi:hypothetical protein